MKPTIALMPKEDDIQKVPRIHIAALLCILLSSLREYANGTLL